MGNKVDTGCTCRCPVAANGSWVCVYVLFFPFFLFPRCEATEDATQKKRLDGAREIGEMGKGDGRGLVMR